PGTRRATTGERPDQICWTCARADSAPGPRVWNDRNALRRNRQTLAPLGAAPLENDPAVLGAHPHEKSMGATAAAAIRLKSTLHLAPGWVSLTLSKTGS